MRLRRRAACTLIAVGGLLVTVATSQVPQKPAIVVPAQLTQLLTKQLQFSTADIAAVGRGVVVVKSLPTGESREVAIAGAFWCDVPLDYFLTRARDIISFKRVKEVQQIGLFESPARPADLEKLTVDAADIELLRRCQPGDCKFRLDGAGLERLRRDVAWAKPEAPARCGE